jgi:predicted RNase H-like HicB family nuclease
LQRKQKFTVLIERDADGYFLASVPALKGCHTQAKNLNMLMRRVREVISLYIEVKGRPSIALDFVGVHSVVV